MHEKYLIRYQIEAIRMQHALTCMSQLRVGKYEGKGGNAIRHSEDAQLAYSSVCHEEPPHGVGCLIRVDFVGFREAGDKKKIKARGSI